MKSHQPLKLLKGRRLLRLISTRRKMPPPANRKRTKEVQSKKSHPVRLSVLQNRRILLHGNPIKSRPGAHNHPHTHQNLSLLMNIGILALPSCGALHQIMGIQTRCGPAPAHSTTPSLITPLRERTLPRYRATGPRCMDIFNLRTQNSRRTRFMNLRSTDQPPHLQL